MAGDFFAENRHSSMKDRVSSYVLTHPTQSLVSAALLALLLAPGAAFAWRLQTASPNAATTNAFPKQSSTTTFSAVQSEPLSPDSVGASQERSATELKTSVTTGNGETNVQVNGQEVPVPENGSTHTVVDNNGTTVVDVQVNTTTENSSSSYSSTSINLNTSSESTIDTESSFE